jgi:hypothetical protein
MNEAIERHCDGLPAQGVRRLSPDEHAALHERAQLAIQRRRWAAWSSRALLLVAAASTMAFAANARPDTETELLVGLGLGVFAATLAIGAVVYLVVFARTAAERRLFTLAAAAAALLILAGAALPPPAIAALLAGVAVAGLVALPRWVLRRRDARRSASAFAALPLDLAAGEVLVFGDPAGPTVEVLSRSHLRWAPAPAPGPRLGQEWPHVTIHELARVPERPVERPLTEAELELVELDEQHRYRVRALDDAELDELRRLVQRQQRGAATDLFVTFVLARSLAGLVAGGWAQFTGEPVHEAVHAGPVWLAAGLIVAGRAWVRGRALLRARQDFARGEVLRARPIAESPLTAEVVAEFLPVTGLIWTEAGEPATWRRPVP